MRLRGELIERTFAHTLETGGMRRTHLRHHENIAKRMLIHVAGFNLGLLMRNRFGFGKPRCLQGLAAALIWPVIALLGVLGSIRRALGWMGLAISPSAPTRFSPASGVRSARSIFLR
jgi:hypothetical protein